MPAEENRTILIAYAAMIVTLMAWGMVPVFLKLLLSVLTPTEVSFTRFALSGLLLMVWVGFKKTNELKTIIQNDIKLLLLCTLFGPLTAMVFFNYGILHVTIGTAAVFAAIEPLITYAMAAAAGQETFQPKRMLSIILAIVGMCLVIMSKGSWGAAYWGSLFLVSLTPVIWAANTVISKELVKTYSPIVILGISSLLSSFILVPTLSEGYLQKLMTMSAGLWFALFFCVVMGTIFGFTVWYWCLKFLAPSTVAVSMYAIPLFVVAAGFFFLGESVSLMKGTGIFIVLAGLYLVTVRYK